MATSTPRLKRISRPALKFSMLVVDQMAEDYPNSTFVGIDIADMYPKTGDLPPNVRFLKANILEGLPFEDGKFDYVFQRFLIFDLSPGDWKVAIKELARLVKPGYVGS
ncbi:hypothetical protein BC938DRAFT_475794 [Jimgerdemannia flammicorona]|uniref:Methyltransferase domain-containing protein n=1 Tax=Jimgerdemannia flammicorona TaxID=994334 RepID=A0A433QR72_9FUNG|nr:hypothetical protein BC938DRAFT_475794 [Jimgerdemannia flammicorona]